jgi:hypothetical protein
MTALRIKTAVFWDTKPYIFIYVAIIKLYLQHPGRPS